MSAEQSISERSGRQLTMGCDLECKLSAITLLSFLASNNFLNGMLEPSGGVQRLSISYELGQDDFLLKPHSVDVMGVDSGVLTGFCTKETSRMFLTFFLASEHFMTQQLESSRGIHWLPMLQEHRQCDFLLNWWFSSNVGDTKRRSVTQLVRVSIANAQIWCSCIGTYPPLVVQNVRDGAGAPTFTQSWTRCFLTKICGFWTIPTV